VNRNIGGAYSPSWSPDGKRIAFVGYNDGRLYTIGANGKGLRFVLGKSRIIGWVANPRWSPNGKEIAFKDAGDHSNLKAVNLRTRKERVIYYSTDPATGESNPSGTPENFDWSPDGKRIAFYAPYRNWMINSDGTGLRQISPQQAFVSYETLTFSPDGTELAGAYQSEIWAMDGDFGADLNQGGYTRLLTGEHAGGEWTPDWAPAPR
jgi:Tol biopolymer transport system component